MKGKVSIMRKLIAIFSLCFLMLGCSANPGKEVINQQIEPEGKVTVISESQDQSVQILADTEVAGDIISEMTLRIGDQEKKMPWKNVVNPSYYPQIFQENIDKDPDKEILIVLTTGYGTEIKQTELHVLKRDFSEFSVQDPIVSVRAGVKSKYEKVDGQRRYSLIYKDKSFKKVYDEKDAGMWFEDVVFGNIVNYRIDKERVIAEVSAQVSPGIFIGTVEAEYKAKDQSLVVEGLSLNELE